MRLQEVYYRCKKMLNEWADPVFKDQKLPNGATNYTLENYRLINQCLVDSKKIKAFESSVNKFRAINTGLDENCRRPYLVEQEKAAVLTCYENLHLQIQAIVSLYESFNYDLREQGFDIMLPPNITLADLSACTKDLNFVFSQCPILKGDGDEITLSSTDCGSIWLNFLAVGGGILLLNRLAGLIDRAIIIRSHILSCKQQEALIRQSNAKGDLLESIIKANHDALETLSQKSATAIAKEYDVSDPEDIEKVSRSLLYLGNWMSRGMEIYASISASDEVKAVFPPIEQQKLSAAEFKMLSEKAET